MPDDKTLQADQQSLHAQKPDPAQPDQDQTDAETAAQASRDASENDHTVA